VTISRRDALRRLLLGAGALALPSAARGLELHADGGSAAAGAGTLSDGVTSAAGGTAAPVARLGDVSPLDAALEAARWLGSVRMRTPAGLAWPWDPAEKKEVQRDLYTGMQGVVLFHLELHAVTGDERWLAEARAGADELIAHLDEDTAAGDAGLYSGLAGIGYTLAEVARSTGQARYADGAANLFRSVVSGARPVGGGVEWSDATDIISGAAGTLLYLLWARRELGALGVVDARLSRDALDVAARAGRRLVERGSPKRGGLEWGIAPSIPRHYPNFSHGAAGVSYALATLHGETGDAALLDAALAGARYLEAITDHRAGCKVFHDTMGGEQLFYLSWCHGPPGTARLWHRLAERTRDDAWRARMLCGAEGVLGMGAPEKRSSGYWDNISQCCGNCGVGEFFLALHRQEHGATAPAAAASARLAVARRAAADLLARGVSDDRGLRWPQAENRVQPEWVVPQTGLMQGAAGAGLFLLHLDGAEKGRSPRITLPDSPW
jgi:lantibiotic modifying enzyme